MVPKPDRFREFLERLQSAPPAESFKEAFQQIANILNEVENELTEIPFNPESWQTDGRMYPPRMDSMRRESPTIRRFRSRAHNTCIGDNGAIEIQEATGDRRLLPSKPGIDGRMVRDQ